MSGERQSGNIDLHAYMDGALDAAQRGEIEILLAADPALTARLTALRADKAMLRQIYAPLIDRPLPQEWLARLEASKTRSPYSWRLIGAIAAVVLVAIGGTYIYRRAQPNISGEIVAAHGSSVRRIRETYTATDADAPYDGTISHVVGTRVRVPDALGTG